MPSPLTSSNLFRLGLPRWNQILTWLRFMNNWVITGIESMDPSRCIFFQICDVNGLVITHKRTWLSQIWLESRGASRVVLDSSYNLVTCWNLLSKYGNFRLFFPHNVVTWAPFFPNKNALYLLFSSAGCENSSPRKNTDPNSIWIWIKMLHSDLILLEIWLCKINIVKAITKH
jgi:hypothetical protein